MALLVSDYMLILALSLAYGLFHIAMNICDMKLLQVYRVLD
jgi:hypothetical protein